MCHDRGAAGRVAGAGGAGRGYGAVRRMTMQSGRVSGGGLSGRQRHRAAAAGGAGGNARGDGPGRATRPACTPPGAPPGGCWRMRGRRSPRGSAPSRRRGVHLRRDGGRCARAIACAGRMGRRRPDRRHASTMRCAPRAPMRRVLPVDRDGVADLDGARAGAAGRAGAGLPDAGQQRDRHDPAGGRGRRAVPPVRGACCMWTRCRRPGASRSTCARSGADSMALSSPQARRPGGRRGAAAGAGPWQRGADRRRRAGAGRRGGTPAVARHRRVRGRRRAPAAARPGRRCGTAVERAVAAAGGIVLGGAERLPNTVCAALPGVRGADTAHRARSGGRAGVGRGRLRRGKVARSHVLEAMGLGALAGRGDPRVVAVECDRGGRRRVRGCLLGNGGAGSPGEAA